MNDNLNLIVIGLKGRNRAI